LIDPHGDLAETLAAAIGDKAILWNVAVEDVTKNFD